MTYPVVVIIVVQIVAVIYSSIYGIIGNSWVSIIIASREISISTRDRNLVIPIIYDSTINIVISSIVDVPIGIEILIISIQVHVPSIKV